MRGSDFLEPMGGLLGMACAWRARALTLAPL